MFDFTVSLKYNREMRKAPLRICASHVFTLSLEVGEKEETLNRRKKKKKKLPRQASFAPEDANTRPELRCRKTIPLFRVIDCVHGIRPVLHVFNSTPPWRNLLHVPLLSLLLFTPPRRRRRPLPRKPPRRYLIPRINVHSTVSGSLILKTSRKGCYDSRQSKPRGPADSC